MNANDEYLDNVDGYGLKSDVHAHEAQQLDQLIDAYVDDVHPKILISQFCFPRVFLTDTVMEYIEAAQRFEENAAGLVLKKVF